jgi:hypothetical protein
VTAALILFILAPRLQWSQVRSAQRPSEQTSEIAEKLKLTAPDGRGSL